jgi:hypothetical protein
MVDAPDETICGILSSITYSILCSSNLFLIQGDTGQWIHVYRIYAYIYYCRKKCDEIKAFSHGCDFVCAFRFCCWQVVDLGLGLNGQVLNLDKPFYLLLAMGRKTKDETGIIFCGLRPNFNFMTRTVRGLKTSDEVFWNCSMSPDMWGIRPYRKTLYACFISLWTRAKRGWKRLHVNAVSHYIYASENALELSSLFLMNNARSIETFQLSAITLPERIQMRW